MTTQLNAQEAIRQALESELAEYRSVEAQIEKLTAEQRERRKKVHTLNEAYTAVGGESLVDVSGPLSIPALAEKILRKNGGELTADQIVEFAGAEGRLIRKQSLVTALIRYVERGVRFRRAPGKNRFGLIEDTQGESNM